MSPISSIPVLTLTVTTVVLELEVLELALALADMDLPTLQGPQTTAPMIPTLPISSILELILTVTTVGLTVPMGLMEQLVLELAQTLTAHTTLAPITPLF
jgi:hypothetical protein